MMTTKSRYVEADEKQVSQHIAQFLDALRNADFKAIKELYTDDGVFLPVNHAPVEGKTALGEFFKSSFDGQKTSEERINLVLSPGGTVSAGDLIIQWGTIDPGGKQKTPTDGSYLFVFKKLESGEVKFLWDIDNLN